jgi:hypothetical protein
MLTATSKGGYPQAEPALANGPNAKALARRWISLILVIFLTKRPTFFREDHFAEV